MFVSFQDQFFLPLPSLLVLHCAHSEPISPSAGGITGTLLYTLSPFTSLNHGLGTSWHFVSTRQAVREVSQLCITLTSLLLRLSTSFWAGGPYQGLGLVVSTLPPSYDLTLLFHFDCQDRALTSIPRPRSGNLQSCEAQPLDWWDSSLCHQTWMSFFFSF